MLNNKQSKPAKKQSKVSKPPERRQVRVGKYVYDVVYDNRKPIQLGAHGSAKADAEYAKFCRDWWARKARPDAEGQSNPVLQIPKEEKNVTLKEVLVGFLNEAEIQFGGNSHYDGYVAALLYPIDRFGDLPVDEFTPLKLKAVRDEMVRSKNEKGTCVCDSV